MTIERVRTMLNVIEDLKEAIVETYNDDGLAYHEKTDRIQELRHLLVKTQSATCIIIQDELDKLERGIA